MSKRDTGGMDSVPRMLRLAFAAANECDEKKAWSFWRSAVSRGYAVQPKTERPLRLTIATDKGDRGMDVKSIDSGAERGKG